MRIKLNIIKFYRRNAQICHNFSLAFANIANKSFGVNSWYPTSPTTWLDDTDLTFFHYPRQHRKDNELTNQSFNVTPCSPDFGPC